MQIVPINGQASPRAAHRRSLGRRHARNRRDARGLLGVVGHLILATKHSSPASSNATSIESVKIQALEDSTSSNADGHEPSLGHEQSRRWHNGGRSCVDTIQRHPARPAAIPNCGNLCAISVVDRSVVRRRAASRVNEGAQAPQTREERSSIRGRSGKGYDNRATRAEVYWTTAAMREERSRFNRISCCTPSWSEEYNHASSRPITR